MAAIEVEGLCKRFEYYKKEDGLGKSLKNLFFRQRLIKEAASNISFSIREGECVGFLGPNGAGKTTTLKMLSGILYPTSGHASVLGYTPWERKNEFKKQFSIVMGNKSQLSLDLPASESIYLNKCIYQVADRDYTSLLTELTELLDVKEQLHVQVRRLSLGERMKLELIASLIHRPRLLFLDEPTIGLDLVSQRAIRKFLKYYHGQYRVTIVLTSHYMKDIEDLCKRVILINAGSVVYDGDLKTISAESAPTKVVRLQFGDGVSIEDLRKIGNVKHLDETSAVIELEPEIDDRLAELFQRKTVHE